MAVRSTVSKIIVAASSAVVLVLLVWFQLRGKSGGEVSRVAFIAVTVGGIYVLCVLVLRQVMVRLRAAPGAGIALSPGQEMAQTGLGSVRIVRSSGYIDRQRLYAILVDGKTAAQVRDGGEAAFYLPPGHYKLSCRIDWYESPPNDLEVAKDGVSSFRVTCRARGRGILFLPWYAIFVPSRYLHVEPLRA